MSEAKNGTVILRDVLDARVRKDDQTFMKILSSVTLEQSRDMLDVLEILTEFSASRIKTLESHEEFMSDITRITNNIKENIAKSKE